MISAEGHGGARQGFEKGGSLNFNFSYDQGDGLSKFCGYLNNGFGRYPEKMVVKWK
jgi:hypothetical protein